MAKFSLALFLASVSVASAIRGNSNLLERKQTRKLSEPDAAPDCGSLKASKVDGSCKASKAAEDTTIECGGTYTGTIILESNLVCGGLKSSEAAITLSGSEASLDCAGFTVMSGEKKTAKGTAIKLMDGASAGNCFAAGFETGFYLDGGDNQLVSSSAFGNDIGVLTEGDGCMRLADIDVIANNDAGVKVMSTGSMDIENLKAVANGSDGGLCIEVPNKGSLTLGASNTYAAQNSKAGIAIEDNGDALTAVFFDGTQLVNNGDDGFKNFFKGSLVTFYDAVDVTGNQNGMDLKGGSTTFDEKATVAVCSNAKQDLENAEFTDNTEAGITCDNLKKEPDEFTCGTACPVDGTFLNCS